MLHLIIIQFSSTKVNFVLFSHFYCSLTLIISPSYNETLLMRWFFPYEKEKINNEFYLFYDYCTWRWCLTMMIHTNIRSSGWDLKNYYFRQKPGILCVCEFWNEMKPSWSWGNKNERKPLCMIIIVLWLGIRCRRKLHSWNGSKSRKSTLQTLSKTALENSSTCRTLLMTALGE